MFSVTHLQDTHRNTRRKKATTLYI